MQTEELSLRNLLIFSSSNFSPFCGHQTFIALSITARPLVAKPNQITSIQYLPLYYHNTAFNIILTTTPFEVALLLHIVRLIKILTPFVMSPILATCSAHLILRTSLAEHTSLWCSHFPMTGSNHFLKAIFSKAEYFCFVFS